VSAFGLWVKPDGGEWTHLCDSEPGPPGMLSFHDHVLPNGRYACAVLPSGRHPDDPPPGPSEWMRRGLDLLGPGEPGGAAEGDA
jgi:hypothetical protein